jgi:hypothetical protein
MECDFHHNRREMGISSYLCGDLLDMGHQLLERRVSNCQLHGTADVIKFSKTVNFIAHFELSKAHPYK